MQQSQRMRVMLIAITLDCRNLLNLKHTYTEDVEAKPLSSRFADQLIWKTVKPHMASELQVSLFFILRYLENRQDKNTK